MKLYDFIHKFNITDNNLKYALIEAVQILFEEPFIDAPMNAMYQELPNDFSTDDLNMIEHKVNKSIKINNLKDFEAFDLYIEQTGMRRADGIIHEPMTYIRDISQGKAVISPRDNISIKLNHSDGMEFLKWIASSKYAMNSIKLYLSKHPDKAGILPLSFYREAIKENTITADEMNDFLPDTYSNL